MEEVNDPLAEREDLQSSLRNLDEISDGLKIKQQQISMYTYGHARGLKPVDWRIIVTEDELVEGEHIRCLQLKEGENVNQLVEQFQSSHAKAVVFVNTRDDFMVEARQWPQENTVPVLLLKASDGKKLLSTLETTAVHGKVEVESPADIATATTTAVTIDPLANQKKALKSRLVGGNKHDFKAKVKHLMFKNEVTPIIMSECSKEFTMVIDTFQQYEKAGKGDGRHAALLKKLDRCVNGSDVFEKDFPFYIILANRIKLHQPFYGCDEWKPFVKTCIEKMEGMDPLKLSSTLNAFVQRGDFMVMTTAGQDSASVFNLLGHACLDLATFQHKMQSEMRSSEHIVYKRMVWVCVALKCHSETGVVTMRVGDIWNRYIIQMVREQVFTPETIEDLRRGLSLTKLLNIPSTAMMSSEQMVKVACVEGSVRPLSHLSNYLDCMAGFVSNKSDIAHLILTLRAHYDCWINDTRPSKFTARSIEGTVVEVIQEGITFVDKLGEIPEIANLFPTSLRAQYQSWIHPSKLTALSIDGTVSGAIEEGITFVGKLSEMLKQKEGIEDVFIHSEEHSWLATLLQLVDVTETGAEKHLMMFFNKSKSLVVKTHREQLVKYLIERTRQSFSNLPIKQFSSLFKHLRIWPREFVAEYLSKYEVPKGINICDGTWHEFISDVISRFSGAHKHHFLLDFIKRVGECYAKDARSTFVLDILALNVPELFSLPETTDKGYSKAVEVQGEVSTFVQTYIRRNSLKTSLLQKMNEILDRISISEHHNAFQQLLLNVLQKDIIPDLRTPQSAEGPPRDAARNMLNIVSTKLKKSIWWNGVLNSQQKFCWGIVATCCVKIVTTDNFDWIHSYDYAISQLGQIYVSYCNGKKLSESERVLTDTVPYDISSLHNDDVQKYFEWVRRVQVILHEWQRKICENDCNYDDLMNYASNQAILLKIGQSVCFRSASIDESLDIRVPFRNLFEKLSSHFIKYIPGSPDAKYCTLPQILNRYGISFPSKFTKHLLLPGENVSSSGEQLLDNPINLNPLGTFQPPSMNVTLQATKALTMKELTLLVDQLDQFVKPIQDHMCMLVFFNLNQSEIFNNYIFFQLKEGHKKTVSFLLTKEREEGQHELEILANALYATRDFLVKLIQGTAKYSEIVPEGGELKLESINIDTELKTLKSFSSMLLVPDANGQDGLQGILIMVEVLQYTSIHIPSIKGVCEQYNLEGCLNDPCLMNLLLLAKAVEESKANLTYLEAVKNMHYVRNSLCFNNTEAHHNLSLFPAVANSAPFFQFVRDMKFDGENGPAVFDQQYQLITAQLQHEEYNENVLNHLYAAYTFILPFMDTKQNFTSLMSRVMSLDVSGGLKQLETVNCNIAHIRLWFSRAEGDTLQNVANDLDCIIQTGQYHFEFASSKGIVISLQYSPAVSAQAVPSILEDGSIQEPETHNEIEGCDSERWSKEQIDDFVRKLGFLDSEKGGDMIKNFLHVNEAANTMMRLYTQLRDLGCSHTDFTKGAKHITLPCNTKDPDSLVQDIEAQLSHWKCELTLICNQNVWMLFFNTPKLLLLHKYMNNWMSLSYLCDTKTVQDMEEKMETMSHVVASEATLLKLRHELHSLSTLACSQIEWAQFLHKSLGVFKNFSGQAVSCILKEISFLCENDAGTFSDMNNKVETILNENRHNITTCLQTPILAVSMLLSALLQNHSLPTRIKPVVKKLARTSVSPEESHVLHSCPGFTQKELILVILRIFGGVPEPFQIFRCQPSSTQEEISLFLQRSIKFPIPHLIIEVNKLPFHLQEHLIKFHLEMEHGQSEQHTHPCLHYIETMFSNLRDMPWITLKECKAEYLNSKVSLGKIVQFVQLVYGNAGDGKTYYIKKELNRSSSCSTIAVNEAFTPLGAIKKLQCLPSDKCGCAIFFNFTLHPPGGKCFQLYNISKVPEHKDQRNNEHAIYHQLMEVLGWFFFDLLVLGYVEDKDTGLSFRLPAGLNWVVYVEVPSRDLWMTPDEMLEQFRSDIPTLDLLGTPHLIRNTTLVIDNDVQLVCKYLRAYKKKKIDQLLRKGRLVKFSNDENISENECHKLLNEYMPVHIKARKITQHLFIKYMSNRCQFLDCLPAFNYNSGLGEYKKNSCGELVPTNTKELGSTLMETMLNEVSAFCDPAIIENWSHNPHQQLIYDFKDGGGSLDLISLHADKISQADRAKFINIGVNIFPVMEMHSRKCLDKYLSRALNVELINGRLKPIDDASYVLTLDYTLKMLNIHERCRCGVPVIIEGETGVGKTALVQMLSVLWNHSLLGQWNKEKSRIHDILKMRISILSQDSYEGYEKCVQLAKELSEDKPITYEDMLLLCNLPGSHQSSDVLYTLLRQHLLKMRHLLVVILLDTKEKSDLCALFEQADVNSTAEATAKLLQAVYFAEPKSTFYKLNIHAALTPPEIQELLRPAFDQARELHRQSNISHLSENVPFVTVFLDEVNTSSCLGLFKEVIVDRTFDGEPIPKNVFIVAACNPHRGNSLASHEQDRWLSGSYYVRPLHPTLQLIMWDYGSLDKIQERDYINAKMKMLHGSMSDPQVASLTDLIVDSQEAMRDYAAQQLRANHLSYEESAVASRSCVSQRDIQRVFTLHEWLMKCYDKTKPYGDRADYHRRALLVALAIVYYMRLNKKFRAEYKVLMDKESKLPNEVNFSKAIDDELKWYINQVELPEGIAKTEALKENIFATIICTVTRIPLVIVGAPGSSKTLSFNITIANLKGLESKTPLFRQTDKYPSLDPHYYQCSRRTTSNEIQTVFSRAINRQKSHMKISLPINCVVFMDEAGLPEESHESLKVLHYFLDNPEVSFVAITNHVLDAAKTNRAISLFRPESSGNDLETLAKGCWCSNPDNPPHELKNDLLKICALCNPYLNLMEQAHFKHFYGLRDFIHFINYLRRKRQNTLNAQIVLEALERNFNGSEKFEVICKQFLPAVDGSLDKLTRRKILDVLRDSLADHPNEANRTENEVRYKLIIDPSEDDSTMRLLFMFGILDRQKTRVFVCSDFPGDTHLQKINTIAAIRHSAIEGHTVLMAQTDDIHESFYDLFNQRFRRIDDAHGPRYYANIAIGAHSKPCRVHPEFQCLVVIKQSEVKNTPAPFLNRFEKYNLSHYALLEAALSIMPPCMAIEINTVREKIIGFVKSVKEEESFYGLKMETVDSLLLSILPTERYIYQPYELQDSPKTSCTIANEVICLQELICAFVHSAGFHISSCSLEELTLDAHHVSSIVCADPEFQGLLQTISPQRVVLTVAEAVQKLHEAPAPQGNDPNVGLSSEGCIMVAMAVQWLLRHLCKHLMQVMTPEALIIHRKKISSTYLINYLKYHSHFSLKVLIKHRLDAFGQSTIWMHCPTKLICYTRTSPLIQKLPLSYTGGASSLISMELTHEAIKDLVLDDPSVCMVHKLSNKPQSSIRELLRTFTGSKNAQLLLLIANMAEVTVPMVNHLRIMIEEAEILSQAPLQPKLFVLLLHFPPHKFLNPCYPTLFMRGWDHYYLDTISQHHGNGIINVEDWFSHCCFPPGDESDIKAEDSLVQTTRGLLEEAIPIILSRVPFSSHEGFPFNGHFTISQRGGLLHELLITKEAGMVLCKLFRSYWTPSVISGYLDQAASLAHQQQSTLNITDTIQAAFKATFMDFMVVMVSRMNENCNIDSVFFNGGSPAVDGLFRALLAASPLPLLTQLKVLSNNLQAPCNPGYIPVFPFFHMLMGSMDQLIEQCRKNTNEVVDVLGNAAMSFSHKHHDMQEEFLSLRKILLSSIKEKETNASKECLVVCMHAVVNNPELWPCYFSNFIFAKLHLAGSDSNVERQIIQEVFGNLNTLDIPERIVYLHTYMAVYQLELAKVATILRSLFLLQKIKKVYPSVPSCPSPSSTNQLVYYVHQSGSALSIQYLTTFVISALFKALLSCMYASVPQAGALEQQKLWYKTYLDIKTLPSLANNISVGAVLDEGMELVRAQLNVMQATFAVLQCKPDCDREVLNVGQKVFSTLFNRHFKKDDELKDKCPNLAEVCQVALKYLQESIAGNDQVHRLIGRLFTHFFPVDSTNCSTDDCCWFLHFANNQSQWVLSEIARPKSNQELCQNVDALSIHIFKLYLCHILGEQNGDSTSSCNPLAFYNDRTRSIVGEVLMSATDLGPPTHYKPIFYQRFITLGLDAISARMQQPLAHLYFLMVLEHLFGKQQALPALLQMYSMITKLCTSPTTNDQEKVLLYIELQAVVQATVQQVAVYLDPSQPNKNFQLSDVIQDVNSVLEDPATGGGACKGHAYVLALHLLKCLKSFRKFTHLLTVQFDSIFGGITCLEHFSAKLKSDPKLAEPKQHPFPFIFEDHSPLATLYQNVRRTMLKIDDGKCKIDDLIKIAQYSFTSPKSTTLDTKGAFRMVVWLTVYYDFFDQNKISKVLQNSMDKMSRFFEQGHIAIIQRFLNPDLALPSEGDAVFDLQQGSEHLMQSNGKVEDPLLKLFRPSKSQPADQSDVDLRHALANMVAAVIASPKASNHLWYHMFSPGELQDTYMTGFMYESKVNSNGLQYNCGVELSPDGLFGRQDYLKHACRGTYTLHSLYLLLWANFGAFCMALFTQPNAEKKLQGTIISDWLSIRHYCVSQLRKIWLYMRNNLNITDEERSFLVMRCMKRFYEMGSNSATTTSLRGKLLTREELDTYEKLWHTQIYQPSWTELKEVFSQYSLYGQNPVFLSIRSLDELYPWFHTEKDFTHILLSSDISLQKQGGGLSMLTQFVLERPQIEAGGHLLPDLVEFYLWLHTQLAYIVSYENATELTIGKVIERIIQRYSSDFGKHMKDLYERVKVGYNAYVKAIGHAIGAGACVPPRYENKVYTIADDMPLLHFLSDTLEEEEEGNDWLYTVMADIVNTHNNFIERLYTMSRSQCLSVNHLLPSEPSKIPLSEFTQYHCIVGKKKCLHDADDFLQLVRSRYCPQRTDCAPDGASPKATRNRTISMSNSAVQQSVCQFNLHLLQEDILATYLAGKPLLESASSIRTHFKFRNKAQQSSPHPTNVASSGGDIDIFRNHLPDSFKVSSEDSTIKKLEFEFHSASYLTLLEAVQAMKNVLGHLINFIKESKKLGSVNTQTVRQFMAAIDDKIDQNAPVFAKASTSTLSPPQMKFLENLPIAMVFTCLQLFIQWLNDGMYDFHTLPFALKTKMSPEDQEALHQIPNKWKGGIKKLLDELRSFTDTLDHSETYISKNTNNILQTPIKKVLEDFHFLSHDDLLPKFIPDTIFMQNYVVFRIALRGLVTTVAQQCVADIERYVEANGWQEFVGDIWNRRLPHFRDSSENGGYSPTTEYGFQKGCEGEEKPLADVFDDDAAAVKALGEAGDEEFVHIKIPEEAPDNEEFEDVVSPPDVHQIAVSMNTSKEELVCAIQKETAPLEDLAMKLSVEDVVDFLHSIKMDQYIDTFRREDINGILLVAAGNEELKEIGVLNPLHSFKIQFLFKRFLQHTPKTHPLVVVDDFLAANKIEQYRQKFAEEKVDGDMLFEIIQLDPNIGNSIFEELGIKSKMSQLRMRQWFKTHIIEH